jgi:LppX_LprAFG lipoprotein
MGRNRSLVLCAAAAAVGGLLLTGCSSGTTTAPTASTEPASPTVVASPPAGAISASPAAYLSQAADATTAAGTAKFTAQISTGDDKAATIGMDGAIDFSTEAIQVKVSSAMLGGTEGIEVVVVDGQSYIKMPMFQGKWMKTPAQKVGVNFTDPTDGLSSLKNLADLKEVGTEEIDGVSTTHYTGTLDLKEALAQANIPSADLAKIKQEMDRVKDGATVDVWVDDEGRVVQIKTSMSLDTGTGKPVAFSNTMKFFDFGAPVDIKAPSPDQVISPSDVGADLKDLAPQGE